MVFAVLVAGQVYRELDNIENLVVTSARDGVHKRGTENLPVHQGILDGLRRSQVNRYWEPYNL